MSKRYRTRLEEVMDKQGRKKSWLASMLGVDNSTVTRWISGTSTPEDPTKEIIARLLGVSVGFLFFNEGVDPEVYSA